MGVSQMSENGRESSNFSFHKERDMKRKHMFIGAVFAAGLAMLSMGAAADAAIVQHSGANDPATEGWTYGSLVPSGTVTTGAITNDAGSGYDTWYVNDDSAGGYGLYYQGFTSGDQTTLLGSDWTATLRLRMPNNSTSFGGAVLMDVNLGPSNRRFLAYFGTDASGNPVVYDNSANSLALTTLGTGYHLYELKYDKVTSTVDLFIDNVGYATNWAGIAGSNQNSNAYGQVQFGSGAGAPKGQGNYSLVQVAVPEPTSLSLLGLAGIALIRRRRGA